MYDARVLKVVTTLPPLQLTKKLNVKGGGIALTGTQSQSYGASPAIWDHTVLPATRHR